MKLFKKIQVGLLSTVSVISTGVVISSCGHKKHPAGTSFSDFSKAVLAESAINIVQNAHPPAQGWDIVQAGDLSKEANPNIVAGIKIIIIIDLDTKNKAASFTATYVADKAYDLSSDWGCSVQPDFTKAFDTFRWEAERATPADIVKNANPGATGWNNMPKGDIISGQASETFNSVIRTLHSTSKGKDAQFTALYTKGQKYSMTDWKCTRQPY